jgi:hypothetical protein
LRYYYTSCLWGDGTTMYHHDLHTIRCYLTQERIYMGWGFQWFSRYLITPCIKRDRTILYGLDLHTIRCYLTQETRIYRHGLGVGISTAFEIFGHFLNQGGGQDHSVWLSSSHNHLLLDIRNKNIYMV